MKPIARLLVLLSILVSSSTAWSEAIVPTEGFDSVTVPALPSGWTSVSLTGSQNAVTSSAFSSSAPNAALLPAPSTTSLTALVTPVFNFSTAAATYELTVNFYHKRGTEPTWDGGVLEVSTNGGPFVDVTSPSIGGIFDTGGYNNASVAAGPLAGRKAWSGASVNFEEVSLRIPSISDNSTLQFRFLVGTDASVSGPGWYIDRLVVRPSVNTSVSVTPLLNEISPNGSVNVDVGFNNPTSLTVNPGLAYFSTPSSVIRSLTLPVTGIAQRIGNWLSLSALSEPQSPLTTSVTTVALRDTAPNASARLSMLNSAANPPAIGVQASIAFVSSSPAIPNGTLDGETTAGTINPCAPPAIIPPTLENGKIVIQAAPFACPFGQAALAYQARGAIAFIGFTAPSAPPPPFNYPSPVIVESATPGLTIPTFATDQFTLSLVLASFFSPGTTARLEGFNSPERRTIAMSAYSLASDDPVIGDGIKTALVNVVTDVDGDGTPDFRDGCKNDGAKTAPGPCGCGIAEVDSNANGVLDCFATEDFNAQVALATAKFKSQVTALRSLVRKLDLRNKRYKTQRTQISNLRKAVAATGSSATISTSGVGISIPTLTSRASKAVNAVIRAKNSTALAAAKKKAAKELTALRNGIA